MKSRASSSLTQSPSGAYMNEMLCVTKRRAPAALAASIRFPPPSVLTRLVGP